MRPVWKGEFNSRTPIYIMAKLTVIKYKRHYVVKSISRADCEEYIIKIHYAHRYPSITWAFGLFADSELCGIVSYGTPPSHPLRTQIAGPGLSNRVIELNRLCLKHNRKNEASLLVSKSIKLLPPKKIIVSFADTGQNHVGTVYQAANFIYTGLSADGSDYKIRGLPDLHYLTILDKVRGLGANRGQALRDMYGDDLYFEPKTRKHRYVFIHGDRKFKREVLKVFKYVPVPYPKADMTLEQIEGMSLAASNIEDVNMAEQIKSSDFEELLA